jgi:hypothetical protein
VFELPPPEITPDEARDAADRVLSGRAYTQAARGPSLRDRFFDWIGDQIGDLLSALSTTGGRGFIAWIIIGVLGAAIIFLATRLLRGVGRLPVREAKADPVISIVGDRSSKQWLDHAIDAEAGGNWREGIRSRHRSLVAALIDRDLLTSRPGQTAGEISETVARQLPTVAGPMQAATWLFNDVWYGWTEPGPEHRDEFSGLADRIVAGAIEHGQRGAPKQDVLVSENV